jgi:hypothetical protein
MTFTIADFAGTPIFADSHLFFDPARPRKRSFALIDRPFTRLRLHRNAEALRLLEADWQNSQFIKRRRMSQINALASEVDLMEREYNKSRYDASFRAAMDEVRSECSLREKRAEERLQSQLCEHGDILRDLLARADEREQFAKSLADQEREHLERESESLLAASSASEKEEYERLQAELGDLERKQDQYRKNREKLIALKAERDEEATIRKPVPALPPRIALEKPQKPPRRVYL